MTLVNVPDEAARLQGLLSGSLDVAHNIAPDERNVVEAAGGRLVGFTYPDGFEMASLMAGNNANADEVQQLIAADLARVGVHMEIQRTTFAKYLEYMYQTGYPDPYVAFAMVSSGFDPLHGFRTRSCNWLTPYYCDEAAVPMIAAAESAFVRSRRTAATGPCAAGLRA